MSSTINHSRRQSLIEIILIFAIFAIQGGWPLPDNNEVYYLGKAIHYWNPDWHADDFFLETADAHEVFYFTFGWLSLWLSPTALAYTGRAICWLLLAWGWRRMSFAAVPRAWTSILTAALFVCMLERFHMAGEWVVGGVEAKPFGYALVFFGLAEVFRNRWNWGLLLLGAATALHPLVGGWSAVAVGFAWLRKCFQTGATAGLSSSDRSNVPEKHCWSSQQWHPSGCGFTIPPLKTLWPGIVGGLLLSLAGVIPTLTLDWGVDGATARAAHMIYVYERLPHHLYLGGIYAKFILRLDLLFCFWILLGIWRKRLDASADFHGRLDILRGFVAGAILLAMIGGAIHVLMLVDDGLTAGLLRYYWFRLVDVALPLGVAIEVAAIIVCLLNNRPALGRCCFALAVAVAAFHVGDRGVDRLAPDAPRTHKLPSSKRSVDRNADFRDWYDACRWVADSGEIPPDAVFFTPRLSRTFRWYAERSDVVAWKDIPQGAADIVEWRRRIDDIYNTGLPLRSQRWYEPLATAGEEHLRRMGEKYGADYIITDRTKPPLDLPTLYSNRTYIIYRLK